MPKQQKVATKGAKSGKQKKKGANEDDFDEQSNKYGAADYSEEDENQSLNSEQEDEYDVEDDDDMGDFIADEDEELYQEEVHKKKRKKHKNKDRKREKKPEDSDLDEEDYELIHKNLQKKRKLTKLQKDPIDDNIDHDLQQKIGQKRIGLKRDRIEDEQYDYRRQDYDDDVVKVEHANDKAGLRKRSHLQDKPYDSTMDEEERPVSHQLRDNFMTDDIDDLFGTPQDQEIAEKDIPERLQIKLKNRFNPTQEQLNEEAQWIFYNSWESIGQTDNLGSGGTQKIQDIQEKIYKVLKMIRNDQFDIPFITKYKEKDLIPELNNEYIWRIFNLDIEYGKFEVQKKQIEDFFNQIKNFSDQSHDIDQIIKQIYYIKNHRDLKDFHALVDFYKSYYQKELEEIALNKGKKLPVKRIMFVRTAREKKLDEFSRKCTLSPALFVENLDNDKLCHKPNANTHISPKQMAKDYIQDVNNKEQTVQLIKEMCVYTAVELWCHPDIRKQFKKYVKDKGIILTLPTAKGEKELDVFHPSYRVKRVNKRVHELADTDLFLDILQNESLGLITCTIAVQNHHDYFDKMFQKYQSQDSKLAGNESSKLNEWEAVRKEIQRIFTIDRYQASENKQQNEWSRSRKEIQRIFCQDNNMVTSKVEKPFIQSIIDEVKEELKEDAENYVIQQCRKTYKDMIQLGYFTIRNDQNPYQNNEKRADQNEEDIIPQRERLNVLGAILHPIDNRNYMTTIAVVNKYGDLECHKDFLHLIPPRPRRQRQDGPPGQQMRMNQDDGEMKKHEDAKEQFKDILNKYKVDLIVVCADSLEARKLKKCLAEFSKYTVDNENQDNENDNEIQEQSMDNKEAVVVWGRPEIPKLFASSHYSQKLLKNHPFVLKKAICLARYEQDPMNEILNLWSPIMSENQTLNVALHPMQKHINKARLMDVLEEVNIRFLNNVGVDINLVCDHDHMFNQLQFLSGLGPRKAQRMIQKLKQQNNKVETRLDIQKNNILDKKCFKSSIGFIKVRVPVEKRNKIQGIDLLDQTRIHFFQYERMQDIAVYCIYRGQNKKDLDDMKINDAVLELLKNPQKLMDNFPDKDQITSSGEKNADAILIQTEQIINDFIRPFKDPREDKEFIRDINNTQFSQKELMYSLIDETERSFKEGMIVSATVVRKFDKKDQHQGKIVCRLENGLEANIFENDADFYGERAEKIDIGHVVQGRVTFNHSNIRPDEFNVILKCKKKDLINHELYMTYLVNEDQIKVPPEDYINANFQVQEEQTQIQRRAQIQKRKIQHPRFQNISSTVAINNLKREDNGEFYFRPSSRGTDHLTLTWRFYETNIVHIDIQEFDKAIGANIGSRLKISDEFYENLQEIVERYITPCNRSLREVTQHQKFFPCKKMEEVQAELEKEKAEASSRIPYKFVILDDYPQYVILCYIPSKSLVREFIKVKPRGYNFHGQYHYPFQSLINWFKQQFRSARYQTFVRKTASPQKIGAISARNQNLSKGGRMDNFYSSGTGGMQIDQVAGNTQGGGQSSGANWGIGGDMPMNDSGPIKNEDNGFNSKMKSSFGRGMRATPGGGSTRKGTTPGDWGNNDDNGQRSPRYSKVQDSQGGDGGWGNENTQQVKDERERGGGGASGWGGAEKDSTPGGGAAWSNRGGNFGGGGSNFGGGGGMDDTMPRSERRNDGAGRGRGRGRGGGGMDRPRNCFNCQQEGHFARECPEPKRERGDRYGDRDDGAPSKRRRMDDGGGMASRDLESTWNKKEDTANNDGNAWGNAQNEGFGRAQETAGGGGWGANDNNDAPMNDSKFGGDNGKTAGGWGDDTGGQQTQNDNNDGGW